MPRWRAVAIDPRYQVSDDGQVKGLKGQLLKQYLSLGYPAIGWRRSNGRSTSIRVHRLVAMAFVKNPNNKRCVNHKNGDRTNNHWTNLGWCTIGENVRHSIETGLNNNKGENGPNAKLTNAEVREIRQFIQQGEMTQKEIAVKFGISEMTISRIKNGSRWAQVQ